jgi:2-dehydropantoate 2-reductase
MSNSPSAPDPLRIAVIGAGAVGGVFGARLAQHGHDVVFVARGTTRDVLRRDGLQVESVDGDVWLRDVRVTDDVASIGVVDVVLVCVKSTQIAAIAPSLASLVGADTAVIPLQNGVEASSQLAETLGPGVVLEGLCRLIAEQTGPGRIRHSAVTPVIEFGARRETPQKSRARLMIPRFAVAITGAGMTAIPKEGMEVAQWEKFMFIEPYGTVGGATRMPIGVMRTVPETRELLASCVREVVKVGRAAGVDIPDSAEQCVWDRYDALPHDATASMQRDLIAGRPSEFEQQTGAVVRLASRYEVPIPAHRVLYAALKAACFQSRTAHT